MRAHFRVKRYRHPRLKFLVRTNVCGQWQRKFFETEAEAVVYAQEKERELLEQGTDGAAFPAALRVMAQNALSRLRPFGKTLTDAADFFVAHLEATTRSAPTAQVVGELLHNRRGCGTSERYIYELRLKLDRFARDFVGRTMANISTADIDAWLESLALAPGSRNTYRRDLHTLFSFAVTRHYAPANPVSAAARAKDVDGEAGILSVEELTRLLRNASAEMLPFWTIGAFAGLRRAEIERLDWPQVDLESRLIEVKACHSKTGSRRLVTMQPNLIAWLAPHRKPGGSIIPSSLRTLIDADRDRAGMLAAWPRNALRHSFGSYHLARFNDTAALALQMGNSPDVIFRYYRQLVRPADAERYWSITPQW